MIELKPIKFPKYEDIKDGEFIQFRIRKTIYMISIFDNTLMIEENTIGHGHYMEFLENTESSYKKAQEYIENNRKKALEEVINGEIKFRGK